MADGIDRIHEKIRSFQKRYYLNIFIRGTIITLAAVFCYFLLAALLEHMLWLGQWARLLIFFSFFILVAFCIYHFLKDPLSWWIAKKGLGEQQSASIIGGRLPAVKDRLLNLIQLEGTASTDLVRASVRQKTKELEPLSFDDVVDLSYNTRFLKYLFIPLGILLIILVFNQAIITKSTERIINFNKEYSPEAPFKFILENESLTGFYNEDFTVKVKLHGTAIPESIYLDWGQRLKMESLGNGEFSYTFENLQQAISFQLEAAGFYSDDFQIILANRPELTKFNVSLEYPKYIRRKNESISNAGNLEVPEGTLIRWNLQTSNTNSASILFASDSSSSPFKSSAGHLFSLSKKFTEPDQYEIVLENDKSKNAEKIAYSIGVVKDAYPQITVNNFRDSVLYKRVILGGSISDDYGTSELSLHVRIRNENQKDILNKVINIDILKDQLAQNFFYNWSLDSLKLKPGEQLEYYLQVWDNDGVNGRKSTRSANYTFLLPTEENLIADIDKSRAQTQQKIDQSATKANKLQEQIEQTHQKLKGKQNLDWQDKKMLQDIVDQKQNLDRMVEQLQEQNKLLQDKKETFTEQDERIKDKAEQIQKLMDELLDEETKKLFQELEKLLKENSDVSQIQKLLDKLNQNTNNLEKELDRMLELFKQVEFENKLDLTIDKLKEQVKEQQDLLEKTESLDQNKSGKNEQSEKSDKRDPSQKNDSKKDSSEKTDEKNKNDKSGSTEKQDSQDLAKEQQKLNEEFKETTEKIDDLKKLSDELNKDQDLPTQEESDKVEEEQKQSKESLEQNKPSKAKQNQQKALKQMQDMQKKMEGMQNSMEMEMDMQNLESLRQIIHGLIKLSYDQENLIKNFSELQQNDPRFNTLAQQQLKLKDDAKVLEDSLLAIAKRDPFMGSVVTKEIGELNFHLDKVTEANRERKRPQASNEMQLSMTSINNLALMLDDHFDMMMEMMANAQPSMKKSKQKGKKPSLSEMQQQLNQKIEQLKKSGKSGRELSEELANMAAEQERIRRAVQEMQEKMKNPGQMPGGDLPSKMEQSEMDLVNKQLTDQMIKRQKEILTRLLETEKSVREQDMDEERKGETAKDYEKEIPKAFEEYLRLKEKEVELLKTVPPKLYPYYKKEVGEYFKRIGN